MASAPPWIDAASVAAALDDRSLIDALRAAFADGAITAPTRSQHRVGRGDALPPIDALIMPAWREGAAFGVKLTTVAPGNDRLGLPSVQAVYALFDAENGRPLAFLDATALTLRRTACASALAAEILARPDASTLAMIGAGALVPHLIEAHRTVRPIERIRLWNRDRSRAEALAATLHDVDAAITVEDSVEAAVNGADLVSCATMSAEPLVKGAFLDDGAHLDLVGAYRPDMRECDGAALARAELFVDTRGGVFEEAGDILLAIAEGAIAEDHVRADLAELCRGAPGRSGPKAVTAFKSCGAALEDLTAAELTFRRVLNN